MQTESSKSPTQIKLESDKSDLKIEDMEDSTSNSKIVSPGPQMNSHHDNENLENGTTSPNNMLNTQNSPIKTTSCETNNTQTEPTSQQSVMNMISDQIGKLEPDQQQQAVMGLLKSFLPNTDLTEKEEK